VRSGGCSGGLPPADKGGRMGAGFGRSDSSTPAVVEEPSAVALAGASAAGVGEAFAATAGCSAAPTGGGAGCSFSGGSATATAALSSDRRAGCSSPWTRRRTNSATGSSMELEWVFFSITPSSGSISRRVCDGISSCLASSLMRILLIVTATPLELGG
jgi:hypothetical protein